MKISLACDQLNRLINHYLEHTCTARGIVSIQAARDTLRHFIEPLSIAHDNLDEIVAREAVARGLAVHFDGLGKGSASGNLKLPVAKRGHERS